MGVRASSNSHFSAADLNPQFQDSPEALSVIMVPVTHWSDGTPAPAMR
ncbi:MAG: hypothetical protein ABSC92_01615 [Rhizomicrobium sp.]